MGHQNMTQQQARYPSRDELNHKIVITHGQIDELTLALEKANKENKMLLTALIDINNICAGAQGSRSIAMIASAAVANVKNTRV